MENNYYDFTSKGSLNTLAVVPDLFLKAIRENDWSENGGRYVHDQLMFNQYPPNLEFPVAFTFRDGRNYREVLEIRVPFGFLISDRLLQLFEESNLTGWKSYEVIVRDKNGNIVPGYHGFTVTGVAHSHLEKGMEIPDFFRPLPYRCAICTQRVKDIIKANKIKDFEFTPIAEEGYSSFLYDFIKGLI